jgi:predicted nucleic acid-binding protein
MNNSSAICIDAGLVVRLVADPDDQLVQEQWAQWRSEGCEYLAPTLLYYEVANGIYKYVRAGFMSQARAHDALEAALAMPVQLVGNPNAHRSAWAFTVRFGLPATYDAHYLAVADQLGLHLYTVDGRLHNRVKGDLSWVHLVGGKDEP